MKKLYKIYETMVMDIRQHSDPWEREKKWNELCERFSLVPWESFQDAAQRRGTQVESNSLLSWGDGPGSPGRPRQLEFSGQSTREWDVERGRRIEKRERQRQRYPEICRGFLQVFSWALVRACVWGNYLSLEKQPNKSSRGNNPWRSHKTNNSFCSH